ncbi:hypothetical protein RND71_038092 [Anisodus tanguticus]|uniref:Transposase-associated domain-containing protein n=1 Tax=Anisodus tanguticus TaxID=243964 RepID=A0AAE1QZD9_9SOLA|nr:hypothetical protein RND71_038092 [Anisodus tanguticus]
MEPEHRKWMYDRKRIREEFVQGVDGFIDYAMSLYPFLTDGVIRCLCLKCKCPNFEKPEDVKLHLYKKGFEDDYYVWTAHVSN